MTKVSMKMQPVKSPEGEGGSMLLCLTVEGHAGYAPRGKDIVCAAVSMLVQALAGALTRLDAYDLYDFCIDGQKEKGTVCITAAPTHEGWPRVRGMFDAALTGFDLLAKSYPAYVSAENLFKEEDRIYER